MDVFIVVVVVSFLVVYLTPPLAFRYCPFIQRLLLFMNTLNIERQYDLSQPEKLGIKSARRLRLNQNLAVDTMSNSDQESSSQLGVWHILPGSKLLPTTNGATNVNKEQQHQNRATIDVALAFADSRPIVLYLHGNGGNRGGTNRCRLYRRLAYEHDYHVVTFDYRGFGDSTYVQPSAGGLTLDALFMYQWLLDQPHVTRERVVVWGHSLGTAVATRMVSNLQLDLQPSKLILEAPFDSVANAIVCHPWSKPFRMLPGLTEFFLVKPIQQSSELNFDSLERVSDIKVSRIMILHAEDDRTIPAKLGYNLYRKAARELGEKQVEFVSVGGKHGSGHRYICRHKETMLRVKKFVGTNDG